MPVKYDQETIERTVRLFQQRQQENVGESEAASVRYVAALVGIPEMTVRGWARGKTKASGHAGAGEPVSEEVRRLRRENAELKRANAILKSASAFFAAELDRQYR